MGISRFGKRYQEKLNSAAQRARDEEERLRNLTPAEKVSEAAGNLELLFRTGETLANALKKALEEVERQKNPIRTDANGWFEAGRRGPGWTSSVRFQVVYDLAQDGFLVDVEGPAINGPKSYFIGDEVLNRHSKTTVTFHAWIMQLARALYVILLDTSLRQRRTMPTLVREAIEQMEDAGVSFRGDFWNKTIVDIDEEAEAIASIRRSLEGPSSAP